MEDIGAIIKVPVTLRFRADDDDAYTVVNNLRLTRELTPFIEDMLRGYAVDAMVREAVDRYRASRNGFQQLQEHLQHLSELYGKSTRLTADFENEVNIRGGQPLEDTSEYTSIWDEVQARADMENPEEEAETETGTQLMGYSAVPEVFKDVCRRTSRFPIEPPKKQTEVKGLPRTSYQNIPMEQLVPMLVEKVGTLETDIGNIKRLVGTESETEPQRATKRYDMSGKTKNTAPVINTESRSGGTLFGVKGREMQAETPDIKPPEEQPSEAEMDVMSFFKSIS